MKPDKWERIKDLYEAVLMHPLGERPNFLDENCDGDEQVRREVESLLSFSDDAGSFLEKPAVGEVAEVIVSKNEKLAAGQRLSHYEILSPIGEGGMGEVYLARDVNLNRKVALKLLAAHITEDKNRVNRFRQEAFATSALNHPNIITIYEIGEWQGGDFISTEFIEGITLRTLLRKKKLGIGEVLDIILQIASALAAAHGAGIVHRDIKPENIIIRPDGLVKVLDFGIAKFRPSKDRHKAFVETEIGEVIGTAAYMSPEQARGLEIDARTDIWSLGVILYEMIARKLPFQGETKSDRIAAILERGPAPLREINRKAPPQLQQIVDQALAKDKKQRYANIDEMAEDLRPLRETTSDKSHAPFILSTRKRFAFQPSYLFTVFALIGLLVGAIALSYYFSGSGKTAVGDKKSVAVLPVKPINTASRDEIYEIGIANSLIHRISAIKGFVARPLSATRKYADFEQDPIAAGREQQTDYVLASNYQLAGGKIRITSQLFNVASGQIEETYKSAEKDTSNVFTLQDAIADEVGKLLQVRFATVSSSPAAERGTSNEEAYRLYLQAMYLVDKEKPSDSKRAIELLDEALILDPNYAKAWAGKARAHCHFAHTGGGSPDAEFAKAKPAIERAFALDNNLAEAHAVLGIIKTDYDWNFAEGEKQFRQAIDVAPNSDIFYRWLANRLSGQGRFDEAITMAKTAVDINPNYVVHQFHYGRTLYFARRYDDAITQLERVAEMDSAQPSIYNIRWRCFHKKGDYVRAYESFIKFQQLIGTKDDALKNYETLYARNGWQSVLLKYLETVKASNATGSAAYTIAALSALAGGREQSFHYLDEAVKNRSLEIYNIKGDPSLDSLRDDPRLDELVRRVESKQN